MLPYARCARWPLTLMPKGDPFLLFALAIHRSHHTNAVSQRQPTGKPPRPISHPSSIERGGPNLVPSFCQLGTLDHFGHCRPSLRSTISQGSKISKGDLSVKGRPESQPVVRDLQSWCGVAVKRFFVVAPNHAGWVIHDKLDNRPPT